MAQVTHLKSNLQALLRGHYLRELSTPDTSIKYEDIFNTQPQEFVDYVDGRQIFVGLLMQFQLILRKRLVSLNLNLKPLNYLILKVLLIALI